jgi:uncharacterized protein (DUF2384 family)
MHTKAAMLSAFFDEVMEPGRGFLSPQRMSRALRMPLSDLSRVTHLHRNTLARKPQSDRVQARLGEIARIIALASDLVGNSDRAIIWFRHQPLAGFAHKTAEELVSEGHGRAVLKHLEMLTEGGYA